MKDHSSIERSLQAIYAEEVESTADEPVPEQIDKSVRRSVAVVDVVTLVLGRLWRALVVMLGGSLDTRGR